MSHVLRKDVKIIFFAGHDKRNANSSPDGYKEHTANLGVCNEMLKIMSIQGFGKVTLGNPDGKHMSLSERAEMANKGGYQVAIFVHFDAMGRQWQKHTRGLHVFVHPEAPKDGGKALALEVYHKLTDGTIMPYLGVKTANFQVLRETIMPSCLVELAFMDNKEDRVLMASPAYWKECALEITEGVCNYINHEFFKPEIKPEEPSAEIPDYKEIIKSLTKYPDPYIADIERMDREGHNWKQFIRKIYNRGW